MWKCKQCETPVQFTSINPAIDNGGLHFICPTCQARNILINVGEGEYIELMQPFVDWDEFKRR
jgi:Zn finger protein HypA/HybF involved in hydrogenase expression